jgi:hypothetical protein
MLLLPHTSRPIQVAYFRFAMPCRSLASFREGTVRLKVVCIELNGKDQEQDVYARSCECVVFEKPMLLR